MKRLMKQQVTLEITFDDGETRHPDLWEWEVILPEGAIAARLVSAYEIEKVYSVGDVVRAADLPHLPIGALVSAPDGDTMYKTIIRGAPHWINGRTGGSTLEADMDIGDDVVDTVNRIAFLPPAVES